MTGYANIERVEGAGKKLALTFDDGPDEQYTQQILDILQQYNVHATFFMVGEQLDRNPALARAVHEAGHEIGNHTQTHPFLAELDVAAIRSELTQMEDRIVRVTGAKPVTFRPPYFSANDTVFEVVVNEFRYKPIGAVNLAAQDWDSPGTPHIVDKTMESVCDGGIFIFHDGYGDRSQTVEAIRILVPRLLQKGYELVRVDQLFG